jgi:hypothetical protein
LLHGHRHPAIPDLPTSTEKIMLLSLRLDTASYKYDSGTQSSVPRDANGDEFCQL